MHDLDAMFAAPVLGALGLDLGAPTMLLAHDGAAVPSNRRLASMAHWVLTPSSATLWLHEHLSHELVAAAGLPANYRTVAAAVPVWLGAADRRQLVGSLTGPMVFSTRLVGSPLAGVAGWAAAHVGYSSAEPVAPGQTMTVLCIDTAVGWSASIIEVRPDGLGERASVGVPPTGRASVAAGAAAAGEMSELLGDLLEVARSAGVSALDRVIVLSSAGERRDPTADLSDDPFAGIDFASWLAAWAPCPIEFVTRADVVAIGASIVAGDRRPGAVQSVNGRAAGIRVAGALGAGDTVLVCSPAQTSLPVWATQTFETGGVAAADVSIDLYEQRDADADVSGERPRAFRWLATARTRGAPPGETSRIALGIHIDDSGVVSLAGGDCWTIEWRPGVVRSIGAAPIREPAIAADIVIDHPGAAPDSREALIVQGTLTEATTIAAVEEALLRCERLLSRETGVLVAVRSVFALLDCDDDAGCVELVAAADRLDAALAQREDGDELTAALVSAVRSARGALNNPHAARYVGGTAADVDSAIIDAVDRLTMMLGSCSDAERSRLLLDARLLGPSEHHAQRLISRALAYAGVGGASTAVGTSEVGECDPSCGRSDSDVALIGKTTVELSQRHGVSAQCAPAGDQSDLRTGPIRIRVAVLS